MIVWVTGARGFIGRNLSLYLARQGQTVFGIGAGQWSEKDYKKFGIKKWLPLNLDNTDKSNILSQIEKPDVLYHLAGGSSVGASLSNPFEDFNKTINSASWLVDWLKTNSLSTSLVIASSAAVYGDGYQGLIDSGAKTKPSSPYGFHKLMLEEFIRSYGQSFGINAVIVRLFSVYGPFLFKQLLWDLCNRIAAGSDSLELGGDGNELRDWTEISDVVRLLEASSVLAAPNVPILNGGSGRATTVRKVSELILKKWDKDIPINFSGLARIGDPYSLVSVPCSISGLRFPFEVQIEKGISSYVQWFMENSFNGQG